MITARPMRRGLFVGVALVILSTGHARAEHEPARLGLQPVGEDGAFFALTLEPGASASLELVLTNHDHAPLVARTYAADAYSLVNGGFGAELADDDPSGTTLWLDYPSREVRLEAHAGTAISFTLSVPADTTPGEYIAALVAENTEPFAGDSSGVGLEQVNRVALAVAIDVPGAREPALDIGSLSYREVAGRSTLSFEVANPGNVHLRPEGTVWLREASGSQLLEAAAIMETVYAGSATWFEIALGVLLQPGGYCAELSLSDPATGAGDRSECLPFERSEPDPAASEGEQRVAPGPGSADGADDGIPIAILSAFGLLVALVAALVIIPRLRRRGRVSDEEEFLSE